VTVRDAGSANGVFLNGKKIERSRVNEGDVIKLGDVSITLLPEEEAGTVVMEDMSASDLLTGNRPPSEITGTVPEVPESVLKAARPPAPRSAPPPPPPSTAPVSIPAPRVAAPRVQRPPQAPVTDAPMDAAEAVPEAAVQPRPLTVTTLAILWALSVVLYSIGGFALGWQARGAGRLAIVAAGLVLAVLAVVMALGLWQRRHWAYIAQLTIAVLGLFVCPFSLASIAVLVYMLRPGVRWQFSDRSAHEPEGVGQAEAIFTGAIVATVALGVLLTATLTFLARNARTMTGGPGRLLSRTMPSETVAAAQLRAVVAAEEAFHSVCNTGYADLEALRRPASVIKDYPSDGPAFLRDEAFDDAEREGYRFALSVEGEMPAAAGCPARRYRRYAYAATPLGPGRSLMVGPDGAVHAAQDRPATLDDPVME